jgi:di/tricarboxylate transporter
MQSEAGISADAVSSLGLLPLRERGLRLIEGRSPLVALALFAAAVGIAAAGLLPITIAFLAVIIVYVVLDIVPVREIYDAVDWPIIVLLAALMPLGGALESTGATQLLAARVGSLGEMGMPAWAVLVVIMIATMMLSDVINNAATALVMAPIAAVSATSLGVSADPFYMAVAVGASCAFLTPIGHQCNTLVMGPGGYHFGDYWRMGVPLEAIVVAVATPMILLVWPL